MKATFEKTSLGVESARLLIQRAEAKAAELGLAISTTVVDESGVLKAFGRMDGAPLLSIDASRKKALTAIGFGLPTGATWQNFIQGDPILENGVHDLTDFTLLGGGFPIRVGSALVGAIGVSGGHYKQDESCAAAALEALAKQISQS